MNAAEFYERFKDALKFLDVPWGQMEQADVKIVGNLVSLSTPKANASFEVIVVKPEDL